MTNSIDFKLFAICNEEDGTWFNAFYDDWVNEISGECLFPTYEFAFDFMVRHILEDSAKIYSVRVPYKETNCEYVPVHLPCN